MSATVDTDSLVGEGRQPRYPLDWVVASTKLAPSSSKLSSPCFSDLLGGCMCSCNAGTTKVANRRRKQLKYITDESFAVHLNCYVMTGCVGVRYSFQMCVLYVEGESTGANTF